MKIRKEKPMTKLPRAVASIFLTIVPLAAAAVAQSDAQKAFSAIKGLSGTWEGADSHGTSLQVTFKESAGGSVVMSEIHAHGEDMVTMFHLDGPNRLMLTHYCGAGNQPRMQASVSPDGKVVTFNFFDATSLASPDASHMTRVVLTLVDANHHTEEWTFAEHGKEDKVLFDLKRKM
jgi:hypothetical protein